MKDFKLYFMQTNTIFFLFILNMNDLFIIDSNLSIIAFLIITLIIKFVILDLTHMLKYLNIECLKISCRILFYYKTYVIKILQEFEYLDCQMPSFL